MALLYHIELIEVSIKSMPSEKERGNILNQKEKEKSSLFMDEMNLQNWKPKV